VAVKTLYAKILLVLFATEVPAAFLGDVIYKGLLFCFRPLPPWPVEVYELGFLPCLFEFLGLFSELITPFDDALSSLLFK